MFLKDAIVRREELLGLREGMTSRCVGLADP